MRGLATAFTELGWETRLELVRPGASAPAQVAAILKDVVAAPPPGRGLVLLRSHWSLPRALVELRRLRAVGHAVVIDIPTPAAAGVREIRGAPRPVGSKAARLLTEAVWVPLAWPGADVLVQYAADEAPWGLVSRSRRLTLTNGIDVASWPLNESWVARSGVTFVCAGALGPWHGLDRLVQGMAVAADDSRLLVIGDGPELPSLTALVESLGLTGRVEFTGALGGSALDEAMTRGDIGVASLAEHRRGGAALSPLKTRDYLARGMPVLFAGDDPDLRGDPPFTMRVLQDDSAVSVARVAAWLQALRQGTAGSARYQAEETSPPAIRQFALANLQWRSRVEAIVTALKRRGHSFD